MFLFDVGVRERDRRGWKLGSPPLLVHSWAPGSKLEVDSTCSSSGSGGAPGSPGLGRDEELTVEGEITLPPPTEVKSAPL